MYNSFAHDIKEKNMAGKTRLAGTKSLRAGLPIPHILPSWKENNVNMKTTYNTELTSNVK